MIYLTIRKKHKMIVVIVESATKGKKIQKYLGNDYKVISSFGHFRNLKGKCQGVDIENSFKPVFDITNRKAYKHLKDTISSAKKVIIASDEDREGEGIAWHISQCFKKFNESLDVSNKNRIVFHEITKTAIMNAVQNPRKIDMNMVNSQLARQISDYLIGFGLSPVVRTNVQGAKSAGRVQSVTCKLVADKEHEIDIFEPNKFYKTTGNFQGGITGNLNKKFKKEDDVRKFMDDCSGSIFTVKSLEQKECKRKPPPPFITSTLQIEINKRFHIPSKVTMGILQNLYQNGMITYHRTDSITLSKEITKSIKKYVVKEYGREYYKARLYKSKNADAQEAHEAIRPTAIKRLDLTQDHSAQERKIYKLIWKRTVASLMSEMVYDKFTLSIAISKRDELFVATAEKTKFLGYRILYNEEVKDEDSESEDPENNSAFGVNEGDSIKYEKITSMEKQTNPPPRYTEGTLINELKKRGIGRPSTYHTMPTIVLDRGYAETKNIAGEKKPFLEFTLIDGSINEDKKMVTVGTEKRKLVITKLGLKTNGFLSDHFDKVINYDFTSQLEAQLDKVAKGSGQRLNVVKTVYETFNPEIANIKIKPGEGGSKEPGKRLVGIDSGTGKNIYAYIAKYGPVLQVGEGDGSKYCNFDKEKFNIDEITEEEANHFTQFPKDLGDGIIVQYCKNGFCIRKGKEYYSFIKNYNENLSKEQALECIKAKNGNDLDEYEGHKIYLKSGPYGQYIRYNNKNYKIIEDMGKDGNITKEQAIKCIKARDGNDLGEHEGHKIYLKKGPYGWYLNYNRKNYKIKPKMGKDGKITKEQALECITSNSGSRIIKTLGKGKNEFIIGVGQYGPYVKKGKVYASIPEGISPDNITLTKCTALIREYKLHKAMGVKTRKKKK